MAKLGPHLVDYDKKMIPFYHNNQFMVLKGDQVEKPTCATVNQLTRLCSTHAVHECYFLQVYSEDTHNTNVQKYEILNTLPSSTP